MTKFICPTCKKDLEKVGIRVAESGSMIYDVDVDKKGKLINWEQDEFGGDGQASYFCADCDEELQLSKLGIKE